MKTKQKIIFILIALFIIFLIGNPFFIVNEYEQAVITQFGEPMGDPVTEAGLHLKAPFIQKVTYFDKRILEWDGYPAQIPTRDKRYISIDTTARWQIEDPLQFYKSVTIESGAQARLDDIIDAAVRDAVTSHMLIEIVRTSNRIMEREKDLEVVAFDEEVVLELIEEGRNQIRQGILKSAQRLAPEYGIELVDVLIKRVNYIDTVRERVYGRMISERKKAAEEYRSEGRGTKQEIEGRTEKELKEIISTAYKESQEIKGVADKKATDIYAQAYLKDSDFFAFLKALESYAESVNKDSTLILTTDSEYLEYLQSSLSP
jgi:modulator of FtsH protease HflC